MKQRSSNLGMKVERMAVKGTGGIYCRGGDADGDVGIGGGRLAVLP